MRRCSERAAAGRVRGLDPAAVRLGRLADDRQAEAGAGHAARAVGAVEAVEDVRQVGLVEPGPVVADRERAVGEVDLDHARPGGLHLRALSSRFETARLMRSGSPLTTVGSSVARNATPSPARRSARSTSARTIWSRRTSSTTSLGLEPRASSTTSPTSAVSSSSSAMMSARRLSRSAVGQPVGVLEHLDVRAQARDRRAQLVARVGDEVALRLDRALERVERRVEAARQARELVVALDLEPLREVGVGRQRLGAAREARDGRERRARDDAAERGRDAGCRRRPRRAGRAAAGAARRRPRSAAARPAPRRVARARP